MLHKNRRGIELQMHPKASKPVKHTTYYSWTVQPLQRYCFSKVLFNTWLARKWHLLSWGWCDWRQWRGVPSSHWAWALIGHPVPVISFLLSKHQLYPCTLWVSAACHSNPEWHQGILCAPLVCWWTQLVFVFSFFQTFLQLSQVWGPQKAWQQLLNWHRFWGGCEKGRSVKLFILATQVNKKREREKNKVGFDERARGKSVQVWKG